MDLLAFATSLATLALIYGLLALGLNMQFGFAGVLNFGYVAFFAVGAFASALATLPPPGSEAYLAAGGRYEIGFGQPFVAGLAAAALCGGLLALAIGAVSARLGTHYLAVATFALAEVVRSVLGNETWLTRGEFGIASVPQPGRGTFVPDALYAYAYLALCVGVVVALLLVVRRLGEQPFGRLLRAQRADPLAARALGKRTTAARLKALVLGGLLAGIAGSLWTHSLGVVHVGQFVPIVTFQVWLAMLLGGTGNHWGVLLGAILLVAIREGTRFVDAVPGLAEVAAANPSFAPSLRFILIGLLLIAVVRFFPRGVLPEPLRKAPPVAAASELPRPPAPPEAAPPAVLTVDNAVKHFGGVAAVDGASFQVRRGGITGLIGPNGAGKSTLLDLLSGVQTPDAGTLRLDGAVVAGRTPEAAARGLCRTFQNPRLFESLTVWEHLLVAGAPAVAETVAAGLTGAGERTVRRRVAPEAAAMLDFLELTGVRDIPAAALSGGQRKLLSLGCALMRRPRVLLLDEPAAGVNRRLAEAIFQRIAELNRQGMTFLIVEHEMSLVMRYCDHVVVMHQGRVLTEGPPDHIRRHPEVVEAYLGGTAA